MFRLFLALVLAASVSTAGYRLRALSASGALAAMCVGTVAFAWGDIRWYGPLLVFFLSGSFLFRPFPHASRTIEDQTRPRTWKQVCASGGTLPAFLAGAYAFPTSASLFLGTYVALLAAQTADTWATEAGIRWGGVPHDILTGRPLAPGASGGVTAVGTLFGISGAVVLATSAFLFAFPYVASSAPSQGKAPESFDFLLRFSPLSFSLLVGAGIAGLFADSLLGALWERPHSTHSAFRLSNEAVNFLSGHLAALLYAAAAFGISSGR